MRPLLTIGLLVLAGCQMTSGRIIPSPLTYSEQEREILAIAPQGTDRDEAIRRLSAAGIEGNYGSSHNIYYCDLWKRDSGDRWHLNVALLFDPSGKLYKTQVAQADTGLLSSNGPAPGALGLPNSAHSATDPAAQSTATSPQPTGSPGTPVVAPPRTTTSDAWRASTGDLKVGRELRDGSRR